VTRGLVRITGIEAPAGQQGLLVRGVLLLAVSLPETFDPAASGVQLEVEDTGGSPVALVDLTARTTPIPPGGPGTGCGKGDGWRGPVYRNRSNALEPPVCFAGSAHGLTLLRVKDKRVRGGGITFRAVMNGATMPVPAGPLRVTLVLGADAAAGAAGRCGSVRFAPSECGRKRRTYTCR